MDLLFPSHLSVFTCVSGFGRFFVFFGALSYFLVGGLGSLSLSKLASALRLVRLFFSLALAFSQRSLLRSQHTTIRGISTVTSL